MNAIAPIKHAPAQLRLGGPCGSVLEIGFSIEAADPVDMQAVVNATSGVLRPRMGSEAFFRSSYDGLLEDWGLSTCAGEGSRKAEAWYYFAFDRLMSPRLGREIADEMRRLIAGSAVINGERPVSVSVLDMAVRHSQDMSDAALRDARLTVAEKIYRSHELAGGGFAEPASSGWGNPGGGDVLSRPVTVNGDAGSFSVEFRAGSPALLSVGAALGSGQSVEVTSPYRNNGFPYVNELGYTFDLGWEDMLQRLYMLADRSNGSAQALSAVYDLGSIFGKTLDAEIWGMTSFDHQIDSETLPQFGPLTRLGEHVRKVIAMAEQQTAEAGDLSRLAPVAIANLWVAHGAEIERRFLALLDNDATEPAL